MNTKTINTLTVILALLLLVSSATAGDLPAPAVRIWAPAGDEVGKENNLTLAFSSLDSHGATAKIAEDWQLVEKTAGSGLFGWHLVTGNGCSISLRGFGTSSAGSGLSGAFLATGMNPGKVGWQIRFRNGNQSYDPTSEMRWPGFAAPPAPESLTAAPVFEWRMADVEAGYRLGESVKLTAGFDRKCRQGDKGSLLRIGTGGDAVPGVKMYDTTSNEFWGMATFGSGPLGADLKVSFRAADGDRTLDTRQVFSDDRTLLRTSLNLRYNLGAATSCFANGNMSELKDQGTQNGLTIDSKASTSGGRLGVVSRLGQDIWVRLAAAIRKQDTDAVLDENQVDRERSSTDLQAAVNYLGFTRTRLSLDYRYRSSDLTEISSDGATEHALDQDQTSSELDFKLRHKFSRQVSLRARAGMANRETENLHTWSGTEWYTGIPERKRATIDGELALRTKPTQTVRLDLGYRIWDRTIERTDLQDIETTWTANHAFANINWLAGSRISFYGTVAYGADKYELSGDPVPDPGMGPIVHDGTTLRFVPGATLHLMDKLTLDAMYEGIRYEDKGNESDLIGVLQSDSDRMLLRARWALKDNIDLAATYRRLEFMEHRWDNYITDLYAFSVSGRF